MPVAKPIAITLDKQRHLLFNLDAMRRFEKASGKNFFDYAHNMANTNATDLLALIWSCLAHEDPSLSIEQVGNMLTPAVVETIQQSILEAQNISGANEEKSDSAAPGQLKQE